MVTVIFYCQDSEKDPTVNEETRKIYIYGIGSLRDDDLRDYFQAHGEVKDVIIPKQNADPTKIRGFAFVEFSDSDIVDTLVGESLVCLILPVFRTLVERNKNKYCFGTIVVIKDRKEQVL